MRYRIHVRLVPMLLLATVLSSCAMPVLRQTERDVSLSGPIGGGERGQAFGAAALPGHYLEEERFLTGTATSYTRRGEWTADGRWEVEPAESAAYSVRLLIRRPADESDFNGIVVVEWLNVTGLAEGAADYSQMEEELLREGYVWIGVGAQAVGVHAPSTGLKAWDPVRYAPLSHPGDRFSYDIFTQAARAIRQSQRPGHPLAGLPVRYVIATGRSQSAFRLVTYLNAFHREHGLYDGYFVHSRGANAAGLAAESLAPDAPVPVPRGAHIRTDLDVPVFDLQAEGDMTALGSHLTRQPPNSHYRRWELAGVAHTEAPLWVVEPSSTPPTGPGCALPVNSAPHHAFVKSGLRALVEWVRDGTVPPQSPEIQLLDLAAADPIARDEFGNALGGVRIPQLEAPTATLDGIPNTVETETPGVQNFCRLFGRTLPFDDATVRRLHSTHEAFVDRFVAAIDDLERDGYLLPPEAEAGRTAARESRVLR
ncbi:MAG: alpha/beta hydrolase domain-containing protein [Gemmatimonadota bacterium]